MNRKIEKCVGMYVLLLPPFSTAFGLAQEVNWFVGWCFSLGFGVGKKHAAYSLVASLFPPTVVSVFTCNLTLHLYLACLTTRDDESRLNNSFYAFCLMLPQHNA